MKLVVAFLVATIGCGARTLLEVDPPPNDAGVDAGRDAGPDVGGRDAPPMFDVGIDGRITPDGASGCQRDRDCASGRCRLDSAARPADLEPAPLICGVLDRGSERCQTASDCDRGLCVVAGACVAPCVEDTDCGGEQWCRALWVRTAADALQSLRGCVNRFDPHPDVRLDDLGSSPVAGPMAEVSIPPIESAGTLVLYESVRDVQLSAFTLTDGDGRVLFDVDTLFPGTEPPINPVTPFANPLTVLLPMVPGGPISESGWTMTVDVGRARDELVVHRMHRPGMAGRVLDVDVFYVGGGRLAPSGESGPLPVARALDELVGAFGIRLGDVRQHEVVGGLRDRYAILDADRDGMIRELDELLALSAGVDRATLSIFLLREMEGALGITGGIPGPWGANGRASSGIALSVDLIMEPAPPEFMTTLGLVLTHEAGHYFGLFHTTEFDGTVIEPLPGTPICSLAADADGDGFLLPSECAGLGADNVMFWAGTGETVHAQQRALVRSSLLLR